MTATVPDRERLESDFFLDSWGEFSAPSKIDWSNFLYQYGSGFGTFKSVVGGTPSAGVSLWDGELKGSLAASPSADDGAGRSWDVPLVASLLSLDDSGAGSLADSADVPFVASLSLDDSRAEVLLVASLLLVLESASLACGGIFLDPTVMMVPFLFSK